MNQIHPRQVPAPPYRPDEFVKEEILASAVAHVNLTTQERARKNNVSKHSRERLIGSYSEGGVPVNQQDLVFSLLPDTPPQIHGNDRSAFSRWDGLPRDAIKHATFLGVALGPYSPHRYPKKPGEDETFTVGRSGLYNHQWQCEDPGYPGMRLAYHVPVDQSDGTRVWTRIDESGTKVQRVRPTNETATLAYLRPMTKADILFSVKGAVKNAFEGKLFLDSYKLYKAPTAGPSSSTSGIVSLPSAPGSPPQNEEEDIALAGTVYPIATIVFCTLVTFCQLGNGCMAPAGAYEERSPEPVPGTAIKWLARMTGLLKPEPGSPVPPLIKHIMLKLYNKSPSIALLPDLRPGKPWASSDNPSEFLKQEGLALDEQNKLAQLVNSFPTIVCGATVENIYKNMESVIGRLTEPAVSRQNTQVLF
jgi:hypothetical protein